jgi:hypothetical protein
MLRLPLAVNTASLTSSEIRDIILGMEISAPSIQRQQMSEIEASTQAAAQVTAVTTQTTNKMGDTLLATTTTAYEQQVFSSKTDWRIRAISATNIPLRLQHVYVTNDDVKDDLPTFVLAKNLLKAFVCSADLRTPVAGYLFGTVATDNSRVIEVKAIAIVPQRASQRSVELPNDLPTHPLLEDLKIVGIINVSPLPVSLPRHTYTDGPLPPRLKLRRPSRLHQPTPSSTRSSRPSTPKSTDPRSCSPSPSLLDPSPSPPTSSLPRDSSGAGTRTPTPQSATTPLRWSIVPSSCSLTVSSDRLSVSLSPLLPI